MIHCMMLINRQGKIRLMKWYDSFQLGDRNKYVRDVQLNSFIILAIDRCNGNRSLKSSFEFLRMGTI